METTIGACGLVCSECGAFKATRDYDPEAIARIAREWSAMFGHETTPADVWCTGCMSEGGRKCRHCRQGCAVRACVAEKGYSTCAECGDCPCPKLGMFPEGSAPFILLDALKRARESSAKG